METEKTDRFSGRDLLGTDIFGFYWTGYNEDGEIDITSSMRIILLEFKRQFLDKMNNKLKCSGFEITDITYYSPKEYNYIDDELDFHIKSLDEKNKPIQSVTIDEMSDLFELLELTADDLGIDTDWIYNKFIYEKNGEKE